ncbi:hypothetical protein SNE26_02260 [Mucilaginibacter sp. cycad4]|uniref:hypothetical protein n=1 Tax=Mucilaginibacter sp. cycad4 TaxID=3342096 RepID=UPI002AAAEA1C|nr:hypothetical protein [Mucilaginibacter gossypii]WPV00588.1 hypothetical protein SNE26_02260 [Mucilaginibacter gossypii]
MNLIYSTSEKTFHVKPTDDEIAKLKFSHCKTSDEKLIECIERGQPFTAQVYDQNKRHTNNFITQTIFALDFDETITLNEANDICRDFGLNYLFGYYTYRHTETDPRFRLVFICDGEVRDSQLALDILQAFTVVFNGKNDISCLDLARVWSGTNKKVFRGIPDSTFNPAQLFEIANELKYALAGGRSRKIFNFNNIEKTGNNGYSSLYTYRITEIPPFFVEPKTGGDLIDNWKMEDLLKCRLFKTFYEGGGTPDLGSKLNDRELLCMASNLITIVGGEKLYKTCLDRNPEYAKVKRYKISWLRNQGNYRPCLIGNYSPYKEDQDNPDQTFAELLRKRGRVEIDPSYQVDMLTLPKAEAKLLKANERIRTEKGNKVYLVKVPPGLGKTSYWRNQKSVVIGFPSNKLKDEHYTASNLDNDEKVVTPEALVNFSAPVKAHFNRLYQTGLGEVVSFLIKDLAKGYSIFESGIADANDIVCASEYLVKNKLIRDVNADLTVFTTHTRMVYQSFPHDTYVFDENTFGSLFEQLTTTVSDVSIVVNELKLRGLDTSVWEDVLTIKDSNIHGTPNFGDYHFILKQIVRANHFNSNVLKFFQSSTFSFQEGYIHYQVNHLSKLPTDKKIIFLDATASKTLFEKVFGDRLEVIDISNVQLQGTIIQYTSKSCSKSGLSKYHEKISTMVGDSPVITFNEYKKYFKNPDDTLHFGNAVGSNKLEGKDFCVVGTMTYPPMYYKFLADTLMIECDNFETEPLKVTYKGRRFSFKTFANPELQKLHLEQVEGDSLQCVHRGRLIRTNSTVRLFSNFPLLQAKYIY